MVECCVLFLLQGGSMFLIICFVLVLVGIRVVGGVLGFCKLIFGLQD